MKQLDKKSMDVFLDKNVIIYAPRRGVRQIYDVFKYFDINIIAICVPSLKYAIEAVWLGVPIVKLSKLKKFADKHSNVIVQGIDFNQDKIAEIKSFCNERKIEYSDVVSGQLINSFETKIVFKQINKRIYSKFLWKIYTSSKINPKIHKFLSKKHKNPVFLCLPPKTADYTLAYTFAAINKELIKNNQHNDLIDYMLVGHQPKYINKNILKKKSQKIKIITAVREPISQSLSMLYQILSGGVMMEDWIYGAINHESDEERRVIMNELEKLFVHNTDDIQMHLDAYISRYVYPENDIYKPVVYIHSIQQFFKEFKENVVDITQYDFNKEQGYTIIKEGNMEIFIYQLEKLNDIAPQLSEWLGVSFDKFVMSNQASDKWIAESYKEAQNEIKITQEYFERCFDEEYVKHCYTSEDITKFKERWVQHIE